MVNNIAEFKNVSNIWFLLHILCDYSFDYFYLTGKMKSPQNPHKWYAPYMVDNDNIQNLSNGEHYYVYTEIYEGI